MEEKNTYNEINDFLKNLPSNFSILQEQIDIEIQLQYFERAKIVKENKISEEELPLKISELNISETSILEKKDILIELAGIDDVKAFRAIENFSSDLDDSELKPWTVLALQESRMLIESSLLDESQVFISTGLGGKGDKLRYFIVGFLNQEIEFTESQKNILQKEFDYNLEQNDSEVESIEFDGKFALITALIPIKKDIKNILKTAIDECVDLGMDLSEHFMVTNVKKMDVKEIQQFIDQEIESDNVLDDDEITDIEGDIDNV